MSRVERRTSHGPETAAANRGWWDAEADDYLDEHGEFLGDAKFVWGPEGWTEDELDLLETGPAHTVLEVGAGAAQCSRWLASEIGCRVVATDLSAGMLRNGRTLNDRSGTDVPLLQCDALALPFPDATFDRVFTAYGAVPFVADSGALMVELARVLRPGGRLVFSTSHPWRWSFPDDPSEHGLTVRQSYFDTTPYVETDDSGRATYVEHHRTIEQRADEVVAAGLILEGLRELPWKATNEATWGGWSPLRGGLIPGTMVVLARRP
ncbi:MAG: class I SAM-dependent methyltransferase [Actinomycetia bacterium]|nr:class I SAM-dependent methyltransferase [Actinomycetes bacterium]